MSKVKTAIIVILIELGVMFSWMFFLFALPIATIKRVESYQVGYDFGSRTLEERSFRYGELPGNANGMTNALVVITIILLIISVIYILVISTNKVDIPGQAMVALLIAWIGLGIYIFVYWVALDYALLDGLKSYSERASAIGDTRIAYGSGWESKMGFNTVLGTLLMIGQGIVSIGGCVFVVDAGNNA